ncbi:Rid family detoxifying hydrolase [uncultured Olsenella sp.]|uniref:Rid family detoxifying hydrolase n=1 Tax=uncultured Olsenella sp. TaxID=190764 RepID=UPI0026DAEA54|nr:Rid family detoxifying hydrolase [uncultured Olsenella sp.]
MKYSVHAPGVPDAAGPYSQGTTAGRLVFAAGQVAVDPDDPTRIVEGGAAAEAERIIALVASLLSECDCTLSDVAQTTLYLTDLDDLPAVDEVYGRYFVTPAPARSVVEVARLPLGALVEMDCVACR